MKKALGTPFEISFRILILLSEAKKQTFTVGKIAALDFIAVYACDFGLSKMNLHGDSVYRFGEFATRRELVREGIKRLVLDGMVSVKISINAQTSLVAKEPILPDTTGEAVPPQDTQKDFQYSLSATGKKFAAEFESDYAIAYGKIIAHTIDAMASKNEYDLYEIISQRIVASLQRERANG